MFPKELSPKEKRRLEKFVQDLKGAPLDFIARQKLRIILTLLDAPQPKGKRLQVIALEIIQDNELSKITRLRKLINGR